MIKLNKKGFTFVELIVVLAIMVLTVAIAAPNVEGYFHTINSTTDNNALKKLNQSTKAYLVINEISTSDFSKLSSDSARQQALIDEGLIREEYVPQTIGARFKWDTGQNYWLLEIPKTN